MKINWTVRFKNKTFLAALLALVVSFIYDMLALFGVVPGVDESVVMTLCNTVLTLLVGVGVLADPTTKGLADSERAMQYQEPNYTDDPARRRAGYFVAISWQFRGNFFGTMCVLLVQSLLIQTIY